MINFNNSWLTAKKYIISSATKFMTWTNSCYSTMKHTNLQSEKILIWNDSWKGKCKNTILSAKQMHRRARDWKTENKLGISSTKVFLPWTCEEKVTGRIPYGRLELFLTSWKLVKHGCLSLCIEQKTKFFVYDETNYWEVDGSRSGSSSDHDTIVTPVKAS